MDTATKLRPATMRRSGSLGRWCACGGGSCEVRRRAGNAQPAIYGCNTRTRRHRVCPAFFGEKQSKDQDQCRACRRRKSSTACCGTGAPFSGTSKVAGHSRWDTSGSSAEGHIEQAKGDTTWWQARPFRWRHYALEGAPHGGALAWPSAWGKIRCDGCMATAWVYKTRRRCIEDGMASESGAERESWRENNLVYKRQLAPRHVGRRSSTSRSVRARLCGSTSVARTNVCGWIVAVHGVSERSLGGVAVGSG